MRLSVQSRPLTAATDRPSLSPEKHRHLVGCLTVISGCRGPAVRLPVGFSDSCHTVIGLPAPCVSARRGDQNKLPRDDLSPSLSRSLQPFPPPSSLSVAARRSLPPLDMKYVTALGFLSLAQAGGGFVHLIFRLIQQIDLTEQERNKKDA